MDYIYTEDFYKKVEKTNNQPLIKYNEYEIKNINEKKNIINVYNTMSLNDLFNEKDIQKTLTYLFKMTTALKGLEYVGAYDVIKKEHNFWLRNLKRGAVWWVAREGVEEITTWDSDFHRLNEPQTWSVASVDIGANTLISAGIEEFNVYNKAKSVTGNMLSDTILTSVITTTALLASEKLTKMSGIDKINFRLW